MSQDEKTELKLDLLNRMKRLVELKLLSLQCRLHMRDKLIAEDFRYFEMCVAAMGDLAETFDQISHAEKNHESKHELYHRMNQIYDLYFLIQQELQEGLYDEYFEKEAIDEKNKLW